LSPALGKGPAPTRTLQRSGKLTLCIRSSNGNIDAQYDDPEGILKPLWSYVGFRPDDCSAHYGFNLIKQAYEQSGGQNRRVTKTVSPLPSTSAIQAVEPMPAPSSEPRPLEVLVKEVILKLEDILQTLEPKGGRELSEWIGDLHRKNLILRPVADMMHTIRKIRNNVFHSNYTFSKHDRAVFESAWMSVKEWWDQRQSSK
jgi:hypothetical protein